MTIYRPIELQKAKKLPIGTVSHGRKKVAEGKWVPVKEGGSGKIPKELKAFADIINSSKSPEEAYKKISSIRGVPATTAKMFRDKYGSGDRSPMEAFKLFYADVKKGGGEKKKTDTSKKKTSKKTIKVRNQFGKVEEVEVDSDDPILQQVAEKKKATANAKKKAVATLDKKGIKTVKDIDRLRGGKSRYSYLSSLVGKDMADVALRNLEAQKWEAPKKK